MRYIFLRYPEGKTKAVTFSYDDGLQSDLTMAEILSRHGMKGTFNLSSAGFGNPVNLSEEQVKTGLIEKGFEIACHGKSHLSAARLRPARTVEEVLDCRKELEKMFGTIVRGYAYPDTSFLHSENGGNYEVTREILTLLDVAYARTLAGDNDRFSLPTDWLAWMPTAHGTNPELDAYIEKFVGLDVNGLYPSEKWPRLFYIWGHSSEFCADWSRLESICDKLGGKADTWYATNIEIYEYCHAYQQLIWSADGLTVCNPTLLDLWLDAEGTTVKVPSGKTVHLN